MAKKYSINMENDQVMSVEVDGIQYDSPDQIPDLEDQAKVVQLMAKLNSTELDVDPFSDLDTDLVTELSAANDSDADPFSDFEAFEDLDSSGDLSSELEGLNGSDADMLRDLNAALNNPEPPRISRLDWRVPDSQSSRSAAIAFLIFPVIAVVSLAIAAIATANNIQQLSKEESAPGRVVNVVARKASNGQEYYYPVVEFSLPDQNLQTVQLSEGSWPPDYQEGDAVTVAYDPERPLHARIESPSSTALLWILPGITGTLGVCFLIASIFVYWLLNLDRPKS